MSGKLIYLYNQIRENYIKNHQKGAVKQWGGQVTELKKGNLYRHLYFEVADLEGYRQELVARGLAVTKITVGMDHSNLVWQRIIA